MPLKDGSNDEKEDPSPPLQWTTKEDLKEVVLYEMLASPPCTKIRVYLKYFGIPYTSVKGSKKGSAYKKMPVLTASGRQVNDSYIIVKHLIPVLTGAPFNEQWERKIVYDLMLSLEAETFGVKSDFVKVGKFAGFPGCLLCCIGGPFGRSIKKKIESKNPNLRPSVETGKEFRAEIGTHKFHGGDKPDQVDISYYGTILVFVAAKTESVADHLSKSGLEEWWKHMDAVMPKAF